MLLPRDGIVANRAFHCAPANGKMGQLTLHLTAHTMSQDPLAQSIQAATDLHVARRLAEAEEAYRRILAQYPNQPEALHLMGVMCCETGRFDMAAQYLERVAILLPELAVVHFHLGVARQRLGQLDAAAGAFRRALGIQNVYPEAANNLANILFTQGHMNEAIAIQQDILRHCPDLAPTHRNLSIALRAAGRTQEADAALARAQELEARA
jgi:tetratricopeptide (TPR) repeat protein